MKEYIPKYVSALRECAKEHKGDKLFTGQINVSDLCEDTARLLEEYKGEHEKLEKIEQITDDCDSGIISCEQLFLRIKEILDKE